MHQAFSQIFQSAATLGHVFRHVEGKNRCLHCGQTAQNFQLVKNGCSVPPLLQYNEPGDADRFAVFCWNTGAVSFARTVVEAEAFRDAHHERFGWMGPLALTSMEPRSYDGPACPSFLEFAERWGKLRSSQEFSVQETLYGTITNLELPELNSLARCYLRDGDVWGELEQAAWKEIGHFVVHLDSPEPHEAVCRAANDFVKVMRDRGFGPIDIANVVESAQFQWHIRCFAGNELGTRVKDDEAVDRAAYWVLLNCHFYAAKLRDHLKRVHEIHKLSSTGLAAEVENDQPARKLQSSHHGASRWEDIEITFLSDHRVQIRTPGKSDIRNYSELGLNDGRSGIPRKAWKILCLMARNKGFLTDGRGAAQPWDKLERRVQEIRSVLRKFFGLPEDPVPFIPGTGYKTRFKIACGPSFFR
jgi:hypothetical protein